MTSNAAPRLSEPGAHTVVFAMQPATGLSPHHTLLMAARCDEQCTSSHGREQALAATYSNDTATTQQQYSSGHPIRLPCVLLHTALTRDAALASARCQSPDAAAQRPPLPNQADNPFQLIRSASSDRVPLIYQQAAAQVAIEQAKRFDMYHCASRLTAARLSVAQDAVARTQSSCPGCAISQRVLCLEWWCVAQIERASSLGCWLAVAFLIQHLLRLDARHRVHSAPAAQHRFLIQTDIGMDQTATTSHAPSCHATNAAAKRSARTSFLATCTRPPQFARHRQQNAERLRKRPVPCSEPSARPGSASRGMTNAKRTHLPAARHDYPANLFGGQTGHGQTETETASDRAAKMHSSILRFLPTAAHEIRERPRKAARGGHDVMRYCIGAGPRPLGQLDVGRHGGDRRQIEFACLFRRQGCAMRRDARAVGSGQVGSGQVGSGQARAGQGRAVADGVKDRENVTGEGNQNTSLSGGEWSFLSCLTCDPIHPPMHTHPSTIAPQAALTRRLLILHGPRKTQSATCVPATQALSLPQTPPRGLPLPPPSVPPTPRPHIRARRARAGAAQERRSLGALPTLLRSLDCDGEGEGAVVAAVAAVIDLRRRAGPTPLALSIVSMPSCTVLCVLCVLYCTVCTVLCVLYCVCCAERAVCDAMLS
ncbi:hypothetical protein SVAN01_11883 [Stagonosporopsis vannaccii]|nr:hypothetical protein SVAN01_11883 [Stagonosporopsis vannaccii]